MSQHSLLDMNIEEPGTPVALYPTMVQGSWHPLQIDRSDVEATGETSSPLPPMDSSPALMNLQLELNQLKEKVIASERVGEAEALDRSTQLLAQTLREGFSKLPSHLNSPGFKDKKLKPFSGKPGEEVEEFITEATLLLEGYDWNPREEGRFVYSRVEGEARREVKSCGKSWGTAEDIFEILRNAFGETRNIPTLFNSFIERKQTMKESVRSYCNDLFERFERLIKRQEELGRHATSEEILIDYFIEGLNDRSLAIELRKKLASQRLSFVQVRQIAMDWETLQSPSHRKPPRTSYDIDMVRATPDHRKIIELETEVAKLKNLLLKAGDSQTQDNQAVENGRGESVSAYRKSPAASRFQFTPEGAPICALCAKPGHVQRKCPQKAALNGRPPAGGATPLAGV